MKTESLAKNYLISTDLDGTLLDHNTYSHKAAAPALKLCQQNKVPIIFNTSKTPTESIRLREELNNQHPFIVENGSAVAIPLTYFKHRPEACYELHGYWVRCFGQNRAKILEKLAVINQDKTFNYVGFSSWTAAQIAEHTGLSTSMAMEANERDFSEPFLWQDSEEKLKEFKRQLKQQGLIVLRGGRFYHVLGDANKGKAINWLKALYEESSQQTFSLISLGDSDNDIDMLEAADIAIVVKSPVRPAPKLSGKNKVIHTNMCGPIGWNEAISALF